MSLSTGTSVSQFVSHPSPHTDMPSMAIGGSLKGVSYVQIDDPPAGSNGGCVRSYCWGLTQMGVIGSAGRIGFFETARSLLQRVPSPQNQNARLIHL